MLLFVVCVLVVCCLFVFILLLLLLLCIGLVLGGGVVKGFVYIGVIKMFEVNGIWIDVVVGISVGSVVGVLYVGGMDGFVL